MHAESYKTVYLDMSVELCACRKLKGSVFGHECGALCVQKVIRQCIWT